MIGTNDVTLADRAKTVCTALAIGAAVIVGVGLFICAFGIFVEAIK